jgi:hypothetical protein
MLLNNLQIFFPKSFLLKKVWIGQLSEAKITSFILPEDTKYMITEFKYISLAKCGLRNSVIGFI